MIGRHPDRAWLVAATLAAAVVLSPVASTAGTQALEPDLRIVGTSTAYQNVLHTWTVLYGPRPVEDSVDGYSPPAAFESDWGVALTWSRLGWVSLPTGIHIVRYEPGVLSTIWEKPVKFVWDFGDGASASSGERSVAQHRYLEVGSRTITVEMRSLEDGRTVATASQQVEVKNSKPGIWRLNAVRSPDDATTFLLDAEVHDSTADELEYEWDFGDGSPLLEEGPRVEHRFPPGGPYTVTLTATDNHGDAIEGRSEDVETMEVEVVAADEESAEPVTPTYEDQPTSTAATALTATVSGALNSEVKAEIRPFVGLFLGPSGPRRCRLVMTAWDPRQLVLMTLMADLPGKRVGPGQYVLQEGEYTTGARHASLTAEATAEKYLEVYNHQAQQGLGAFALGLARPTLDQTIADNADAAQEQGLSEEWDDEWESRLNREARTRGAGFVQFGQREEQEFAGEPVASSPFGLAKRVGFWGTGGTIELTLAPYDRLEASFSFQLTDTSKPSAGSISVQGDLVLNLQTAPRDGLVMYECGAPDFEVTRTEPTGDRQFAGRASPEASFNDDVDPTSVTEDNFQVGYPDREGNFVKVAGRRLVDQRRVTFLPDEPWRSGVRHTARIRTGVDGVISSSGAKLSKEGDDDWYEWSFWTKIDFDLARNNNLACHLFQPVRDAPLVAGKATVARVYADWKEHLDVAIGAQRQEFDALVVGHERGDAAGLSVLHTFVRPDLWESRGVNQAKAEHTANLFGYKPRSDARLPLRLRVKIRRGEEWSNGYRINCPGEMWAHAPTLTLDWYLAPFGDFDSTERQDEYLALAGQIASDAATFAWQQFPFVEVTARARGIAPIADDLLCSLGSDDLDCVNDGLRPLITAGSDADVLVYFVPAEVVSGGGSQIENDSLGPGAPGLVAMAISDDPEIMAWSTMGLVHEIGHALSLQHKPYLGVGWGPDSDPRKHLKASRSRGFAFKHKGIEAFRIARNGQHGWNKSSSEGNEEWGSLAPLMFPITLQPDEAFIARDHYLALQDRIPDSPRWASASVDDGTEFADVEVDAGTGPAETGRPSLGRSTTGRMDR